MPELARAFERAGFADVRTVLSSGNVVFSARAGTPATLARKAEAAMQAALGRTFLTIVRSVDHLRELLASDPFGAFSLAPHAKRVVTFLPDRPATKPRLPVERDGAVIHALDGAEAFTSYVPRPGQPVFMTLIEKTFGSDVTTRTWDTVGKVAR
jgi:uncharacterized protein (DUF1697 family)